MAKSLEYVEFRPQNCMYCHQANAQIRLETDKFYRWRLGGELIQNIWPEMDSDTREILISGIHPECYEKIFEGTEK